MSAYRPSPLSYNRLDYSESVADTPFIKPLLLQKQPAQPTETRTQQIVPVLRVLSMISCAVVLSSNITLYTIHQAAPDVQLASPYWFAVPTCAVIFLGEFVELFMSALYKAAGQAGYMGTNRHIGSEFVHVFGGLCAVGGVGYFLGDHISKNSQHDSVSYKSIGAEALMFGFSLVVLIPRLQRHSPCPRYKGPSSTAAGRKTYVHHLDCGV
ncbi:hypothetical protein GQ53DRAFT_742234, partial [Thozetella sp. PMI_491]